MVEDHVLEEGKDYSTKGCNLIFFRRLRGGWYLRIEQVSLFINVNDDMTWGLE